MEQPKLKYFFTLIPFLLILLLFYGCQKQQKSKHDVPKSFKNPDFLYGINLKEMKVEQGIVEKNQTISVVFQKLGLNQFKVNEIVEKANGIFDFTKIRHGAPYYIFRDQRDSLIYFVYEISKTDFLKIDFIDSIRIKIHSIPIQIDTVLFEGVIHSSLWNSMSKEGMDVNLAVELSEIFAWTIDFYGIQVGDNYSVYYERKFVDTSYIGLGKIIAARFSHDGKNYHAFAFTIDSVMDYFDEEGKSLRRAFLKAPLKFGKVTSKFSNSRMHPILRIRRPHHGVDYAASSGTPVMTIGAGTVLSASYNGGYGRRVEIRHNGNYVTGYAHLSGFAKGIKKGAKVQQGQIIGYVGSSGLSSGPHLDFRVYKNGKAIDPLNMESPPALPVPAQIFDEYQNYITPLIGKISNRKL